jgi:hypothetical protein
MTNDLASRAASPAALIALIIHCGHAGDPYSEGE